MVELHGMYDPEQEKSLIFKAQAGNREAFGRLYDALLPGLYGYVRARMSSTAEAEDVVSEVVLTAVQKLQGFRWRHPGAFRAWVFQIARRKLADHYRRNPGFNRETEENETLPDASPTPEMQAIQHETRADLLERIRRLSSRKQEVVLLRYFGGLRNKEIAGVLGLNERTVSAHLSRALEELQKSLQEDAKRILFTRERSYD